MGMNSRRLRLQCNRGGASALSFPARAWKRDISMIWA